MSRSPLFLAASLLVLAACQPAADAPQDLVAEAPPPVVDSEPASTDAEPVNVSAAESLPDASSVAEDSEDVAEAAPEDGAHAHEDHDEDHAHEDHDDEHAQDEDGEDHDDHDHAGGEAHVHGVSDLAVNLDGDRVTLSLEGALANFGLDETVRTLDDPAQYMDGIVTLVGGECIRDEARIEIRPVGDHGNLIVEHYYTCAAMSDLSSLTVTAFARYPAFEDVNAVVLTDVTQTASKLTAASPDLELQ